MLCITQCQHGADIYIPMDSLQIHLEIFSPDTLMNVSGPYPHAMQGISSILSQGLEVARAAQDQTNQGTPAFSGDGNDETQNPLHSTWIVPAAVTVSSANTVEWDKGSHCALSTAWCMGSLTEIILHGKAEGRPLP